MAEVQQTQVLPAPFIEAAGKTYLEDLTSAIGVGFRKALPSIIDANVTHFLVALILKIFMNQNIYYFKRMIFFVYFHKVVG